jgi:hypothetical protein
MKIIEKRQMDTLISYLTPYLKDLSVSAPEYGTCGIDITFHAGRPVKVVKTVGISLKPDNAGREI